MINIEYNFMLEFLIMELMCQFKKHILFFSLFLISTFSFAQFEYNFVPLLREDQKRGEEFYCVFQDSKGFIWFGTDMGVIRYDGRNLKYFTVSDGLPDNTVFCFDEDEEGRLWGGTFNNSIFYIEKDVVFTNKIINKKLNKYKHSVITSIAAQNNSVYLGFSQSLPVKVTFRNQPKIEELFSYVASIYVLNISEKKFIYGYSDSCELINASVYKIGNVFSNNAPSIIPFIENNFFWSSSRVLKIKDNYLLLMVNSIVYLNEKGILFNQKIDGVVSGAFYDGNNIFVALRKKGVFKTTLTNDSLHFKSQIVDGITPNVFIDKEHNKWIVSIEDAVSIIPYYRFGKILLESDNNNILFVEKFNDTTLLFGTRKGNVYAYSKSKIIKLLSFKDVDYFYASLLSDGQFWLAKDYYNTSNIIYNIKMNSISNVYHLNIGSVKDICFNPFDTSLFIAEHYKLIKYKSSNAQDIIDTLLIGRVNALCVLKNQLLYGTPNGLFAYDIKDKKMCPKPLLAGVRINKIVATSDSTFILSTHGKGLIMSGLGSYVSITRKEGLVNDIIKCIYFDKDRKNLWVGTPTGLSRIIFDLTNSLNYTIQNFDINSGLTSNIISDLEVIQDTLYVAGPNGITVIPIRNIPDQIPVPKLVVSKIKVNKDAADFDNLNLLLNHYQRHIEISFDAISYSFSSNLLFYYRMQPDNLEWNTTGANEVSFENLNYGKHTFELKACSYDGSVCSDVYVLDFYIAYPFWYRWWFILLSISLITFMIFFIFRLRVNTIRKKVKIKRMLLDAEKKALRAQMNPHFIFNALTSIQKFILTNNTEKADYYVRQFAKLIRLILETSKHTTIKLNNEISILNLYLELEKLRMSDKFDYEINVDENLNPDFVEIPSMLIQPIVENAVWHGVANLQTRKGHIFINFSHKNNNIECIVEDNGTGRLHDQKLLVKDNFKTSLGYSITQKRIELSQKEGANIQIEDLKDEHGNAIGTRVKINI